MLFHRSGPLSRESLPYLMAAGFSRKRSHSAHRVMRSYVLLMGIFIVCYQVVFKQFTKRCTCRAQEDAMNPIKTPTQLRLTQDLLERADALIAVMAADPEVRALGMPTRTALLR